MERYCQYFMNVLVLSLVLAMSTPASAAPVALSLDESIALALKNNPTIKIAEAGREKSLWAVTQAEAGKGFSLDYTHVDMRSDQSSTTLTPVPLYDLYSNQLSLTLPVYSGGRLESQIDQAKSGYKVAGLNVASTREQLKLSATTGYFDVLQTRNLVEVSRQSVDDFAGHLKNVRAQLDAGTVALNDVLQTEVQLANAQDGLIKAQNNYDLAVANLDNIMGLPLESELRLKEDLDYRQYPLQLNDCVQYALSNRPEMGQAQENIAIARDQVKIAHSGQLPNVSFNAANGWQADNFPGAQNSNWTVSLTTSLDVFDSGLVKSQVRQAEYGVTTSQEQARQTRDNIALQVRQAFLSMKEAEKRIDTSKVAVNQAAEDLRMTEVRYEAGVGTNLDVIDAELALTQAKSNYIQALYDYNTGKAQLDQAMGIAVR